MAPPGETANRVGGPRPGGRGRLAGTGGLVCLYFTDFISSCAEAASRGREIPCLSIPRDFI